MKAKILIPLLLVSVVILISNLPPVRYLLDYIIDDKHYRYSNYNGGFAIIDRSGHNVKGVLSFFEDYNKNNFIKNKKLYRLFYKNPLAFWRWYSYFGDDPRYELPYMNWNEIKKTRFKGEENDYYQDF
jgi:hypothetical protein